MLANQPDISFLIPAYNEEKYIYKCVDTIRKGCKKNGIRTEVIVIDNGSIDRTKELAKQAGANVIQIQKTSVSKARNIGAVEANSLLLAFIDADVLLADSWFIDIANNMGELLAHPHQLWGSQYLIPTSANWIETSWFAAIKDRYINGGNMITTKLAFREIGGFNEELVTGEDYDLCHRYLNNRMIVVQRSDFACYHLGNPKNIRRFFFREKWHGQGDYYDLSTFAKSPIAILGVVYAALHVAIISTAILGRWNVSLGITAVLIALNIALTYYRFKNIKNFFSRQVLTYLYFMARFASISYLWSR